MAITPTATVFDQIFVKIIKEQELVIGPLAWEEAKKVSGLTVVNQDTGEVSFQGDGKEILGRLVAQYSRLFGKVSEQVCKEAAQSLLVELPPDQIPDTLK